jgi:hypothetical protein
VVFDGFEISDCGLPLAFLANEERHVPQGIFEGVPCFLVEKRLRAPEVFKKIIFRPDNSGISRSSQRRKSELLRRSHDPPRHNGGFASSRARFGLSRELASITIHKCELAPSAEGKAPEKHAAYFAAAIIA